MRFNVEPETALNLDLFVIGLDNHSQQAVLLGRASDSSILVARVCCGWYWPCSHLLSLPDPVSLPDPGAAVSALEPDQVRRSAQVPRLWLDREAAQQH